MAFYRTSAPGLHCFPSPNAAAATSRATSLLSECSSASSPGSKSLPSNACAPQPVGNPDMGDYTDELWHACAGSLVSVPKMGQRVWYFPQGHMEQVAASTHQMSDRKMPQYNLPSKFLCRVINLILSAEPDSDEVFAQISLIPEPQGCDTFEMENPPLQPKRPVRLFTKILTASDTSTHGGFSVLRKHAEECLPPLDMTQETPIQDLVAKDLHGTEWKFRHTYRGHPRRHLLTTGWSVFVSQKRLVAGDAVVFLRGENGELRVGIRRTKRQQATQSSSVLTSHSMHMGVVATASHALMTRTMFSVFYKPRMSPSPFIVPEEKYAMALSKSLSVGMRFKMRFETEDASERRYVVKNFMEDREVVLRETCTAMSLIRVRVPEMFVGVLSSYSGTITGIEDLDTVCWPNSKWRSLKVNWDEITINERQDRVSPWEVELCVSSPVANPAPGCRNKRFRQSVVSEHSILGPGKCTLESTVSSKHPMVLQGQEPRTLSGGSIASDDVAKSQLWGSKCNESSVTDGLGRYKIPSVASESWIAHGRGDETRGRDLFLGASECRGNGHLDLSSPRTNAFLSPFAPEADLNLSVQESNMQIQHGSPWQSSAPSSNDTSSPWFMSLLPSATHSDTPGTAYSAARPDKALPASRPHQLNQQFTGFPSFSKLSTWESPMPEKCGAMPGSAENTGCKIFGFSLTDGIAPGATSGKVAKTLNPAIEDGHVKEEATSQSHVLVKSEDMKQPPKSGNCKLGACSEQERPEHRMKDVDARNQPTQAAVRSCTKVIYKKGSIVGRGVDLSKFDCYEKLIEELEGMFHIEGELQNPDKGWQVAYSDVEGDMMLVGDDPWTEFCSMVRKIHILSPEEVQSAGLAESRGQGGVEDEIIRKEMSKCSDHLESSVPG